MDLTHAVATACSQHQGEIVQVLAYIGGITPVASILAWIGAKWQKMPPGAQAILQLFAGNVLHALFGEPQQKPDPAPVSTPVQPPAPPASA